MRSTSRAMDFELNQTRGQDNTFGARNSDQTQLSATPATMRDRQDVATIRGFPLYPIEGSRPWVVLDLSAGRWRHRSRLPGNFGGSPVRLSNSATGQGTG